MTGRAKQLRVVATALLLVASLVAGIAAGTDTASSRVATSDYNKDSYEKTTRGTFLGLQSHSVSASDQGFNSYTVTGNGGIDEPFRVRWFQFHWPLHTDDCGVNNVDGAGIDRGNDDTGTSTDESLVNQYEYQGFRTRNQTNGSYPPLQPRGHRVAPEGWNHREVVEFDFYDPNDFGGSTVTINPEDELVFGFRNCAEYRNEGWYRSWVYINGTTESGKDVEFFALSEWVYVCEDCSSREDARQKFGPPPGEGSDDEQSTATATSTPTATSTATATAAPQSTATPEQGTPASSRETARRDTATGTAAQGTSRPDRTALRTATAASSTAVPDTPTYADGPGFGLLAALVAVALVGLRVGRR